MGYGTNVSTPFLGSYKDRLGLGASQTQAIFTVYVVGILATLFVAGPLSDRFGRRVMCVPFVALSGLASLVMVAGRDEFVLLLFGRLLLGVVSGAVLGVGTAWMTELSGPGNELRAAITTTLVVYLGFGLGPIVSAVLEATLPHPLVLPYVLHAALTAAVLPLVLTVPETRAGPKGPLRIRFGVPPRARSTFVFVVAPAALWVFSFPSTSFALFPVLLRDAIGAADVLVAGAAGALTAWSGILSRPVLSRVPEYRALPVGMASGTLGYVFGAVSFTTGIWGLVLPAAALLGFGSGIIAGACISIVGELADDHQRGALTSTFWLLAYLGMAMPVLVTGLAGLVGSVGAVLVGVTVASALATAWVLTAEARLRA